MMTLNADNILTAILLVGLGEFLAYICFYRAYLGTLERHKSLLDHAAIISTFAAGFVLALLPFEIIFRVLP